MNDRGRDDSGAQREFIKMHGLRNHFVIVDARQREFSPTEQDTVRICDPQTGVGADQLIIIEPSDRADAFMRILNTDGREAEACGNATRCVAWLLLEEQQSDAVTLQTRAGILACERAGELSVRCEMGPVSGDWQRIPLSRECDTLQLPVQSGPLQGAIACNVGNPHAVFFVDDLDAIDVAAFAPAIQTDALFPQQVNVGVAEMQDARRMRLAVYERGAGLTMACGSGACAAVYAARASGRTDATEMTVALPGGEVQIAIDERGIAIMTGPVAFCFSGVLPVNP